MSSLSLFRDLEAPSKLPQAPFINGAFFIANAQEVGHRLNDSACFLRIFKSMQQDCLAIDHLLGDKDVGCNVSNCGTTGIIGTQVLSRQVPDSKGPLDVRLCCVDCRCTLEFAQR